MAEELRQPHQRIEIDALDVFRSYAALLGSGQSIVRNANELSYPKRIVKTVLMHMLRLANQPERNALETAYVCLADFQELSDKEAAALHAWAKIEHLGDPNHLSDEQLKAAAFVVAEIGPLLNSVNVRVAAEAEALAHDLKALN